MYALRLPALIKAKFMNKQYGPDVVAELGELKMSEHKLTDEELRQTLKQY